MNTIGNDESDNKKPDNEISDNEKSNNGNTADDYKDGAVTKNALQVITIIGEIEGHDNLPATSKATKYEHMLPKLAEIEMDKDIKGVLFIMNTVGGDVSAGLALAEMIASMKKPTVSLIIGDSHSIGVPLAVSTDYSFIVPTATMIIHPVRMNGTLIGVQQTYDYFERISDRITSFIADHSRVIKRLVQMNNAAKTKELLAVNGTYRTANKQSIAGEARSRWKEVGERTNGGTKTEQNQ